MKSKLGGFNLPDMARSLFVLMRVPQFSVQELRWFLLTILVISSLFTIASSFLLGFSAQEVFVGRSTDPNVLIISEPNITPAQSHISIYWVEDIAALDGVLGVSPETVDIVVDRTNGDTPYFRGVTRNYTNVETGFKLLEGNWFETNSSSALNEVMVGVEYAEHTNLKVGDRLMINSRPQPILLDTVVVGIFVTNSVADEGILGPLWMGRLLASRGQDDVNLIRVRFDPTSQDKTSLSQIILSSHWVDLQVVNNQDTYLNLSKTTLEVYSRTKKLLNQTSLGEAFSQRFELTFGQYYFRATHPLVTYSPFVPFFVTEDARVEVGVGQHFYDVSLTFLISDLPAVNASVELTNLDSSLVISSKTDSNAIFYTSVPEGLNHVTIEWYGYTNSTVVLVNGPLTQTIRYESTVEMQVLNSTTSAPLADVRVSWVSGDQQITKSALTGEDGKVLLPLVPHYPSTLTLSKGRFVRSLAMTQLVQHNFSTHLGVAHTSVLVKDRFGSPLPNHTVQVTLEDHQRQLLEIRTLVANTTGWIDLDYPSGSFVGLEAQSLYDNLSYRTLLQVEGSTSVIFTVGMNILKFKVSQDIVSASSVTMIELSSRKSYTGRWSGDSDSVGDREIQFSLPFGSYLVEVSNGSTQTSYPVDFWSPDPVVPVLTLTPFPLALTFLFVNQTPHVSNYTLFQQTRDGWVEVDQFWGSSHNASYTMGHYKVTLDHPNYYLDHAFMLTDVLITQSLYTREKPPVFGVENAINDTLISFAQSLTLTATRSVEQCYMWDDTVCEPFEDSQAISVPNEPGTHSLRLEGVNSEGLDGSVLYQFDVDISTTFPTLLNGINQSFTRVGFTPRFSFPQPPALVTFLWNTSSASSPTPTPLPTEEGWHLLTVHVVDTYDITTSYFYFFCYDITAPVLSSSNPSNTSVIVENQSLWMNFTEPLNDLEYQWRDMTSRVSTGGVTTIPLPPMDGLNLTLDMWFKDQAGNAGYTFLSYPVLDLTPPVVNMVSHTNNSVINQEIVTEVEVEALGHNGSLRYQWNEVGWHLIELGPKGFVPLPSTDGTHWLDLEVFDAQNRSKVTHHSYSLLREVVTSPQVNVANGSSLDVGTAVQVVFPASTQTWNMSWGSSPVSSGVNTSAQFRVPEVVGKLLLYLSLENSSGGGGEWFFWFQVGSLTPVTDPLNGTVVHPYQRINLTFPSYAESWLAEWEEGGISGGLGSAGFADVPTYSGWQRLKVEYTTPSGEDFLFAYDFQVTYELPTLTHTNRSTVGYYEKVGVEFPAYMMDWTYDWGQGTTFSGNQSVLTITVPLAMDWVILTITYTVETSLGSYSTSIQYYTIPEAPKLNPVNSSIVSPQEDIIVQFPTYLQEWELTWVNQGSTSGVTYSTTTTVPLVLGTLQLTVSFIDMYGSEGSFNFSYYCVLPNSSLDKTNLTNMTLGNVIDATFPSFLENWTWWWVGQVNHTGTTENTDIIVENSFVPGWLDLVVSYQALGSVKVGYYRFWLNAAPPTMNLTDKGSYEPGTYLNLTYPSYVSTWVIGWDGQPNPPVNNQSVLLGVPVSPGSHILSVWYNTSSGIVNTYSFTFKTSYKRPIVNMTNMTAVGPNELLLFTFPTYSQEWLLSVDQLTPSTGVNRSVAVQVTTNPGWHQVAVSYLSIYGYSMNVTYGFEVIYQTPETNLTNGTLASPLEGVLLSFPSHVSQWSYRLDDGPAFFGSNRSVAIQLPAGDGWHTVMTSYNSSFGLNTSAMFRYLVGMHPPTLNVTNGSTLLLGEFISISFPSNSQNYTWGWVGGPTFLGNNLSTMAKVWVQPSWQSLVVSYTSSNGSLLSTSYRFDVAYPPPTMNTTNGSVVALGDWLEISFPEVTNNWSLLWDGGQLITGSNHSVRMQVGSYHEQQFLYSWYSIQSVSSSFLTQFVFEVVFDVPTINLVNGSTVTPLQNVSISFPSSAHGWIAWWDNGHLNSSGTNQSLITRVYSVQPSPRLVLAYRTELTADYQYFTYLYSTNEISPIVSVGNNTLVRSGRDITIHLPQFVQGWNVSWNGTAAEATGVNQSFSTTAPSTSTWHILSLFCSLGEYLDSLFFQFYFQVDADPPTVELIDPTNNSVVLTGFRPVLQLSDPNGLIYYSWDNQSNSTILEVMPTGSNPHVLRVFCRDEVGHWSKTVWVFVEDLVPPQLFLHPANASINGSLVSSQHVVELVADEALSSIQCSWGMGSSLNVCALVIPIIDVEGSQVLHVQATDLNGNIQNLWLVVEVDISAPSLVQLVPHNQSLLGLGTTFQFTFDEDIPTNGSSFAWNDSSAQVGYPQLTNSMVGTYILHWWVSDTAGNVAYYRLMYEVDTFSPTVNVVGTVNNSVVIVRSLLSLEIDDVGSGEGMTYVGWDGTLAEEVGWEATILSPATEGSHVLYVSVVDQAGNWANHTFTYDLRFSLRSTITNGTTGEIFTEVNLTLHNSSGSLVASTPGGEITAALNSGQYVLTYEFGSYSLNHTFEVNKNTSTQFVAQTYVVEYFNQSRDNQLTGLLQWNTSNIISSALLVHGTTQVIGPAGLVTFAATSGEQVVRQTVDPNFDLGAVTLSASTITPKLIFTSLVNHIPVVGATVRMRQEVVGVTSEDGSIVTEVEPGFDVVSLEIAEQVYAWQVGLFESVDYSFGLDLETVLVLEVADKNGVEQENVVVRVFNGYNVLLDEGLTKWNGQFHTVPLPWGRYRVELDRGNQTVTTFVSVDGVEERLVDLLVPSDTSLGQDFGVGAGKWTFNRDYQITAPSDLSFGTLEQLGFTIALAALFLVILLTTIAGVVATSHHPVLIIQEQIRSLRLIGATPAQILVAVASQLAAYSGLLSVAGIFMGLLFMTFTPFFEVVSVAGLLIRPFVNFWFFPTISLLFSGLTFVSVLYSTIQQLEELDI